MDGAAVSCKMRSLCIEGVKIMLNLMQASCFTYSMVSSVMCTLQSPCLKSSL